MRRLALFALTTLIFAAVGLYLGVTIHGTGIRALLACVIGAAAGLGIGVIGYDIARQQHAAKQQADDRPA